MWMNLFVTKNYVAECEFVHMLNDKVVVEREWIYSWTSNEIIKFEWIWKLWRCTISLTIFICIILLFLSF